MKGHFETPKRLPRAENVEYTNVASFFWKSGRPLDCEPPQSFKYLVTRNPGTTSTLSESVYLNAFLQIGSYSHRIPSHAFPSMLTIF